VSTVAALLLLLLAAASTSSVDYGSNLKGSLETSEGLYGFFNIIANSIKTVVESSKDNQSY
jgi:hypothetical protein